MSEFNLHRFIRNVYQESNAGDPKTLAKEVYRRLEHDRDMQLAALEQALPLVSQNFLTKVRGSLTSLGSHVRRAGDGQNRTAPQRRTPRSGSWKNRGGSEYWTARLEERFSIGANQWLAFGDFDIAALDKKNDYHRHMVSTNSRELDAGLEWRELLVAHKVRIIRHLPKDVLRERLEGGEAA